MQPIKFYTQATELKKLSEKLTLQSLAETYMSTHLLHFLNITFLTNNWRLIDETTLSCLIHWIVRKILHETYWVQTDIFQANYNKSLIERHTLDPKGCVHQYKNYPLGLVSFVTEVFVMMDTDLGVWRVYLIINYSYIITLYTTCIISIRCVVK